MSLMKVPHPIPYQGSKRLLAPLILKYFPKDAQRLIEPFAGSAAISLASARQSGIRRIVMNDVNAPLMDLWDQIIGYPGRLAECYARLWKAQLGREREYYDEIRAQFNESPKPELLLYLLARCVKASVRYNSEGKFNQSPDNRRKGMNPATMRWHIQAASNLLTRKVTRTARIDYWQILKLATPSDIVYMDPPYQGVCTSRDQRYLGGLDYETFVDHLHELNRREISYILSYDGRLGEKAYGKPLPRSLGLVRIEVDAGRSTQATLLGRESNTYESVYLSPAIPQRIGNIQSVDVSLAPQQYSLLTPNVL